MFDIEELNSLEKLNRRKALSFIYDKIETALIDSRFSNVEEFLRNLDVEKVSVNSLVTFLTVTTRWRKYLDSDIVENFQKRAKDKIKKVAGAEASEILEGLD